MIRHSSAFHLSSAEKRCVTVKGLTKRLQEIFAFLLLACPLRAPACVLFALHGSCVSNLKTQDSGSAQRIVCHGVPCSRKRVHLYRHLGWTVKAGSYQNKARSVCVSCALLWGPRLNSFAPVEDGSCCFLIWLLSIKKFIRIQYKAEADISYNSKAPDYKAELNLSKNQRGIEWNKQQKGSSKLFSSGYIFLHA